LPFADPIERAGARPPRIAGGDAMGSAQRGSVTSP
jgi:hypothetical protein